MEFSTIEKFQEFSQHKNKIELSDFPLDEPSKTININISFLLQLDKLNTILNTIYILKNTDEVNEKTYTKFIHLFRKNNISDYFFKKNLFLFRIFHGVITNKELELNNLMELAYFKAFLYAITNNTKSKYKDFKGNYVSLDSIPEIEFQVLKIDKYSYFYNSKNDKNVKKEIQRAIKEKGLSFFSNDDILFFNLFTGSKHDLGYIENKNRVKNEFLLNSEIYIIYQDYLILFSFLNNLDRSIQEKVSLTNKFFDTDSINRSHLNILQEVILFDINYLFYNIYDFIFKHFNFSKISLHKVNGKEDKIMTHIRIIYNEHKKNMLHKILSNQSAKRES